MTSTLFGNISEQRALSDSLGPVPHSCAASHSSVMYFYLMRCSQSLREARSADSGILS
jgi:hypothetical protein